MVVHMVKPIPMKESGPSRITIARAMWGRNDAYEGSKVARLARESRGVETEHRANLSGAQGGAPWMPPFMAATSL
jgi:hypothetical protein